jgi:hypothetical protein
MRRQVINRFLRRRALHKSRPPRSRLQGHQSQPKRRSVATANNKSPVVPPSLTVCFFSHIPLVRRIFSREVFDSRRKPADWKQIHPVLLEFQVQVATYFSFDENEWMRRFLLMMVHQILDEPLDNTNTQDHSSLLQLIMRTMEFLDLSDKRMTPIGVGNAVRFMKLQISDSGHRFIGSSREIGERSWTFFLAAVQHFLEDHIDEVSDFLIR